MFIWVNLNSFQSNTSLLKMKSLKNIDFLKLKFKITDKFHLQICAREYYIIDFGKTNVFWNIKTLSHVGHFGVQLSS